MHDTDYLDTTRNQPAKDQVVADGPMTKLWGDIGTDTAKPGILSEEHALAVDFFKEPVRNVGVVLCEVDPDID